MTQPRRVFRGSRRGGGLRQRTDWVRFVQDGTTTVAAGAKALILSSLVIESEATIRRVIVRYLVGSDQAGVSELQQGAVGMHVATDRAITAGAASLLGPVTDLNDDSWFMWDSFTQEFLFSASAVRTAHTVYTVQSRGQRRLQSGQGVVFMVENGNAATGLVISVNISILVGSGLSGRR